MTRALRRRRLASRLSSGIFGDKVIQLKNIKTVSQKIHVATRYITSILVTSVICANGSVTFTSTSKMGCRARTTTVIASGVRACWKRTVILFFNVRKLITRCHRNRKNVLSAISMTIIKIFQIGVPSHVFLSVSGRRETSLVGEHRAMRLRKRALPALDLQ